MGNYIKIDNLKSIRLTKIATKDRPLYTSDDEYKSSLGNNHARLEEAQTLLYANHERAVLIIFQGMDSAGKDGAIKHVMSGVNPQGCSVVSFKTPTTTELDHDFLWKANTLLPARGQIGIFNRSYYEEALITRVHPEILKNERLPTGGEHGAKFWQFRYDDIVHHEKYLHRQGYDIIKIFIHISKNEQKRRLLERFNDVKKQWKISEGDVRERGFWKDYQAAYDECIAHTASKSCPWYIVPGDDKKSARLTISQILVDRFKQMKLTYPKLKREQKSSLAKLKALLARD